MSAPAAAAAAQTRSLTLSSLPALSSETNFRELWGHAYRWCGSNASIEDVLAHIEKELVKNNIKPSTETIDAIQHLRQQATMKQKLNTAQSAGEFNAEFLRNDDDIVAKGQSSITLHFSINCSSRVACSHSSYSNHFFGCGCVDVV